MIQLRYMKVQSTKSAIYNHLKKKYMIHTYIMSAIIAIALFISPVLQAQQEPTGGGWFDSYSLPSFQSILEKTQDTVNWMKETVKEHPRKSFVLGVGALALFGAAYFLMHKQKSQEDTDIMRKEIKKLKKDIAREKEKGTTHISTETYETIRKFAEAFIAKLNDTKEFPLTFTGEVGENFLASIVAKKQKNKEKTYNLKITFNNNKEYETAINSISKDNGIIYNIIVRTYPKIKILK